jgi:hypothetical protein
MAKKVGKTPFKKVATGGPVIDEDGFEVLGGGSGTEMQIGEIVEGTYGGVTRSMPSKQKGKPPIPFYQVGARQLLGGTVLRQRIEDGKVKPGDFLRVTRLEDAPAKRGQNPAKLFDVRVKRKK